MQNDALDAQIRNDKLMDFREMEEVFLGLFLFYFVLFIYLFIYFF